MELVEIDDKIAALEREFSGLNQARADMRKTLVPIWSKIRQVKRTIALTYRTIELNAGDDDDDDDDDEHDKRRIVVVGFVGQVVEVDSTFYCGTTRRESEQAYRQRRKTIRVRDPGPMQQRAALYPVLDRLHLDSAPARNGYRDLQRLIKTVVRELDTLNRQRDKVRKTMEKEQQKAKQACAYCRKADGIIRFHAIGDPKSDKVVEVWLHEACERGYLRLLDEPA
jgi:hypothetical protein